MLSTAALILIVICKVAVGQDHRRAVEGQILQMDMELDSVDDQYKGCKKNMSNLVRIEYLNKEISGSSDFRKAWQEGKCEHRVPEDNLTRNHSVAIYVYTSDTVGLYAKFNEIVRSGKDSYKNRTYTWYSLQFLLTEAIQILRKTQKKCRFTYRGTKLQFDETVLNKEVRFGFFASSSLKREQAVEFGTVSCFEINTCQSADVAKYSKFPNEREVLIPPYETFIVTAIKKRDENDVWCDTVFVLKSKGIRSDLNCAVASVESQIHQRSQSVWLMGLYIFIHFSSLY
ncbi:NAD(P)(+)--arginine ADP-ribosyltransferase 1-like [Triplophysa dalaica]|uniref:NAD(P)(+)--arginine ADP-ribosyltransferase 1-like n=1 Tax=Triplophysa dalaica TaxID=1582913 RepID=UPI0024DF649E|nr:NAD(P)(+)--arginine ADP-ribosyltransferase 1-like [Triplophysa dalaica]